MAADAIDEEIARLVRSVTAENNAVVETKVAALQWRASKLNPGRYGGSAPIAIENNIAVGSSDAEDARGRILGELDAISERLERYDVERYFVSRLVDTALRELDASARKVLHNLSVLMDVFSSGKMQDEAKRKFLGDLWSTLFLVVPVISTTFASVDRMLGDLPPGSIGWLLIDEAGQALPQAAVGAIMRAKRSVVVGDPLQVPPVVPLPECLNCEICKFFKVDGQVWSAPEASSQTLADQASRFQAAFRSNQGHRRVGVPLLVHRRCQEPMFGMSNRIAYDGQMVQVPRPRDTGAIGAILGPSKWFDIDGEAQSKWCPAEGDLVVTVLKKITAAGITDPDLFIITPFRIVAQEMRRRLERESQLLSSLRVDAHEWANTRVGTIHTVQGREADTVIFVLGAPKAPKTVRGSGPQAPRAFSMWPCHELNRTCTLSNRVELGRVLVMLANSHNQCRASGCDDLADVLT
jgi:hypothetical protein